MAVFAFCAVGAIGMILGYVIGHMRGEMTNEYYVASLKARIGDRDEKILDLQADLARSQHDLNSWLRERYEAPAAEKEES